MFHRITKNMSFLLLISYSVAHSMNTAKDRNEQLKGIIAELSQRQGQSLEYMIQDAEYFLQKLKDSRIPEKKCNTFLIQKKKTYHTQNYLQQKEALSNLIKQIEKIQLNSSPAPDVIKRINKLTEAKDIL